MSRGRVRRESECVPSGLGADAHGWFAALDLGPRCVGQVRAMTLTRMDDRDAEFPGAGEQCTRQGATAAR